MAVVLAAAAAWCWTYPSPRRRARRNLTSDQAARPSRVSMPMLAALVVPWAGYLLVGGVLGLVLGGLLAPAAHRAVSSLESSAQRRRSHHIAAQLPLALDLMVAVLEVGHPPGTAFAVAADATPEPLGPLLQGVAHRLSAVGDERAVWCGMASEPDLAAVGRAFARAADTGIPVAHILSGAADEARRVRRARRRDAARRIAVSTAAPLGLCFLPAFFVVGIIPTIISTFQSLAW